MHSTKNVKVNHSVYLITRLFRSRMCKTYF